MSETKREKQLKILLTEAKPIFSKIDKIGKELFEGTDRKLDYYYNILDVLSGCYTYLAPNTKRLESDKKNDELDKYMNLKMEAANNETKFVSAPAEREASLTVKHLRKARNVFQGYLEATAMNINTAKRHIRSYENENQVQID